MTDLTEDLEHTITEFAMQTRDTVERFLYPGAADARHTDPGVGVADRER